MTKEMFKLRTKIKYIDSHSFWHVMPLTEGFLSAFVKS